jgi:hypothetical protein
MSLGLWSASQVSCGGDGGTEPSAEPQIAGCNSIQYRGTTFNLALGGGGCAPGIAAITTSVSQNGASGCFDVTCSGGCIASVRLCTSTDVQLQQASDITFSSVRLNWSASTDPLFSRYEVYGSTDLFFDPDATTRLTSISDRGTATYQVSGLSAATEYHFVIGEIDTYGFPRFSNQISVTTLVPGIAIGGGGYEVGNAVRRTEDGGYIVAGFTTSIGAGQLDMYLVRTTSTGAVVWERAFGGAADDWGDGVTQTPDGGFVVAGWTRSTGAGLKDGYVVRTDANGSLLWERTYGTAGDEYFNDVQVTSDGGFILAGARDTIVGSGGEDAYLVKTDEAGVVQWEATFARSTSVYYDETLTEVLERAGGGYLAIGSSTQFGSGDIYKVSTNVNGVGSGTPVYFDFSSTDHYGSSFLEAPNGDLVIAGSRYDAVTGGDAYVMRVTVGGTGIWERSVGTTDSDEAFLAIRPTSDGGFVAAGYRGLDGLLVKLTSGGSVVWERSFPTGTLNDVRVLPNGGFILVGWTYALGTNGDVYLLETDAAGNPVGGTAAASAPSPSAAGRRAAAPDLVRRWLRGRR